MSAYRSITLIIGLCLVLSGAQAQTVTTNFSAAPAPNAKTQKPQGAVLDYVMPYVPLVGSRSQDKQQTPSVAKSPPPEETIATPPPPKKKPAKKSVKTAKVKKPKPAAPQPAAENLAAKPSDATVEALARCLARFSAREVSRGSNANADRLMAQAAERDCGVEFRSLAQAVTRSHDKAEARRMLEALIRETLSPAVETAMAEAKGVALQ